MSSDITTTELESLSGVTDNVQEQLDDKETAGTAASVVSTHNRSTDAHANGFDHELPMNGNKITELATPEDSTDAATKGYVDGLPGVDIEIVSGIYTCTGDQSGEIVYIDHGKNNVPCMVFAVIDYGGTSELITTSPISLFCFTTIPLVNGKLSSTQLGVLIPDITTSEVTCIRWTALFKEQNFDYIRVPGYESLNELIAVLRSNDVSSLSSQLGVPITIKMADDTDDWMRTLTYDSSSYIRLPPADIVDSNGEVILFAWESDSATIYTSEIAIFGSDIVGSAGESIKNSSGDVIGTLETTPPYMKDYRVMMTSYDTDTISDSNKPTGYTHNARMEFLDVVCTRAYDSGDDNKYEPSDIRAYLISNAADGFLRRLPVAIRNIIIPTNIECVKTYNSSETYTLTDKVFLPSVWELCGTIIENYWYKEGTKSLYYPTSSDPDATRIRYDNGSACFWCTRTPTSYASIFVLGIHTDGEFTDDSPSAMLGFVPAFVIA